MQSCSFSVLDSGWNVWIKTSHNAASTSIVVNELPRHHGHAAPLESDRDPIGNAATAPGSDARVSVRRHLIRVRGTHDTMGIALHPRGIATPCPGRRMG